MSLNLNWREFLNLSIEGKVNVLKMSIIPQIMYVPCLNPLYISCRYVHKVKYLFHPCKWEFLWRRHNVLLMKVDLPFRTSVDVTSQAYQVSNSYQFLELFLLAELSTLATSGNFGCPSVNGQCWSPHILQSSSIS